jgi:transposase InsO family protein
MRELGIRGATRTRGTVTTRSDRSSPRAPDLVNRQFKASRPNQLWVCDFERHEAFLNLAVMKGHRHQFVAADWLKLRAA